MTDNSKPLSSLKPGVDSTCAKCGWSLLLGSMTEEAHSVVCGGLGPAAERVDEVAREEDGVLHGGSRAACRDMPAESE